MRRSFALHASLEAKRAVEGHLHTLAELVDCASPEPSQLLEQGLALLVRRLGVAWAIISRVTPNGMAAVWWAPADGEEPGADVLALAHSQCARVLANPTRTLMCRDAAGAASAWACLGASLSHTGPVTGVLSVLSREPRAFTRAETAMVKAVANLFGKALEIEQLKYDLKLTRDALELTSAVIEDSLLEAQDSGLPNRLYLEVWMKATLFLARRRGESMALVTWQRGPASDFPGKLKEIADGLRGEDLLVDLGKGEFLLLLPRTDQEGALVLVERLRLQFGPLPMGATIWNPLHRVDLDDLTLQAAIKRSGLALRKSRESREASLVWDLLGPEGA